MKIIRNSQRVAVLSDVSTALLFSYALHSCANWVEICREENCHDDKAVVKALLVHILEQVKAVLLSLITQR